MYYVTEKSNPFPKRKAPRNASFAKGLAYERKVIEYFSRWGELRTDCWFQFLENAESKPKLKGPDFFYLGRCGDKPVGDPRGVPRTLRTERERGRRFIILGEAKLSLSHRNLLACREQITTYKRILEHFYGYPVVPFVVFHNAEARADTYKPDFSSVPSPDALIACFLKQKRILRIHLVV